MEPKIVSPESIDAPQRTRERNWAPLAIAVLLVLAVVAALVIGGHAKHFQDSAEITTAPDLYVANLPITNLSMSESANLAGGKVTYLDGHIANLGDRTVSEVTVQVVFRDYAKKVAQSERMPLTLIRMREPYIDTVPVSAAPLKPGAQQDFRLNFDAVSPDWAGATPEVHILHIKSK